MRHNPLVTRFSDLRSGDDGGLGLLFLHELSSDAHEGQPPPGARWEEIVESPSNEHGAALDRARDACLAQWPDQLDGFFPAGSYCEEPTHALAAALKAIESAASRAFGRETLLGDTFQDTRGLSGKQALGAFFTPWEVAVFLATIAGFDSLETAQEQWVIDPACGAGVLLHAYLAKFREAHGREAERAVTLIGVELDARACRIARAALLLAGADRHQFCILHGNSLAQPVVGRDRRTGKLRELRFSVTVANPPFGQKVVAQELEAAAANGPLVVPDDVLNRFVPNPTAKAEGAQPPNPARRKRSAAKAVKARQPRKAA